MADADVGADGSSPSPDAGDNAGGKEVPCSVTGWEGAELLFHLSSDVMRDSVK